MNNLKCGNPRHSAFSVDCCGLSQLPPTHLAFKIFLETFLAGIWMRIFFRLAFALISSEALLDFLEGEDSCPQQDFIYFFLFMGCFYSSFKKHDLGNQNDYIVWTLKTNVWNLRWWHLYSSNYHPEISGWNCSWSEVLLTSMRKGGRIQLSAFREIWTNSWEILVSYWIHTYCIHTSDNILISSLWET